MTSERWHAPVMVKEAMEYLQPERGGLYFDGTLGGGGHAEEILKASPESRVMGVDRDREALDESGRRLSAWSDRVQWVHDDFAHAAETVTEPLSGALLDLGVSSHQIDELDRGFSFRTGAQLDMRMSAESGGPTAADLLNTLEERELADVFFHYGEERRSRRLAAEVVKRRRTQAFRTADDLVAAMTTALGANQSMRAKAKIFQALRIAVNEEATQLQRALPLLRDRLADGGVFVVLSYHSLEDRQVKESFREWSKGCVCPPDLPVCACGRSPMGKELTRKPRVPTEAEAESNPRARSAKLRAWRKAA